MGKVIIAGATKLNKELNLCSWEEISMISKSGRAMNYFAIGDTKQVSLSGTINKVSINSNLFHVYILGFDHNSEREGSGISFGGFKYGDNHIDVALCTSTYDSTVDSLAGYDFVMNVSMEAKYGWEQCIMRRFVLGSNSNPNTPTENTLLSCLPSDMRKVLKPISKYTDNAYNVESSESDITVTTDYCPMLAEFEVYGVREDANVYEQYYQQQYEYYKAGNPKRKRKATINNGDVDVSTSEYAKWWLRSVDSSGSSIQHFCYVGTGSSAENNGSHRSSNISTGVYVAFLV